MISEFYKEMTGKSSVIRQFFAYSMERAKVVGPENVYNFSLGNPSVPCPEDFTKKMQQLLAESDPMAIHGYSPTLGLDSTREKIAASLNKRFGMNYEAKHIFPTTGAAGATATVPFSSETGVVFTVPFKAD